MDVDEELKAETKRLLAKAKEQRKRIKIDASHSSYLKNIDAYISDSEHFLGKGDLIKAFEAVVWSWSWIEILEELGIIKTENS